MRPQHDMDTESTTVRALVPRAAVSRITRRSFLAGIGVTVAGLAVTACGGDKTIAPSKPLSNDIEGQLNYYSWGDYEDPADLDAYRDKFGVRLQVDAFGSNEEMIAKLAAARGTSGYDVIVPTGVYIPQMVAHGLLDELDHSRIPNLANLEERFFNPSWNPQSRHAACKNWGTTGFMYQKSLTDKTPTSWADFISLARGPAKGKVSVVEDPWEVVSIAMGAMNIDPNTTDAKSLSAARNILVNQLAPTIQGYNSSITSIVSGGSYSLLQAWNGDARLTLMNESDPDKWGFVYPLPTANLFTDNFAIVRGTQHPGAAYAFINHMLDPEVSFRELQYIGYQTGVKGMSEKGKAADLPFPELLFPSDEIVNRLVVATVDSATQERTEILNQMQARSAR
ncbi:spermidine/putrescine ABC transporter substrate-binding protein [Gordonia sp. 852002-50816_SCH5313054-c]|uniref:polyamine ABC transporter substrate-binding protein n=1 Tax=unclassified Gordonia (in: high G+C Gram-positive bacteria) TaxID=2657482 RepID=UPI0007EBA56E|nr:MULTISPECIES: spermidine/putrescine ABC transporter substrate-binding protein [unclassified Gordonia (in: high G+C Gram-positive bacteria)]OBC14128.1 spermidine/putrescine ABC transporter substrate-binding protein [Gordonia sp. 852002-50816_SCH5313054-a]OBC18622.1 spermidine/putrescine ABC transporter substrate-binding protein [Gordonia sp. 852002-50816_SCH5313054-c]